MPTNQQTNRNIQVRLELTDVRDMSFHDRFQNPARRRSEQGFTLVELMVVVLIIGVLLGIAIPTFLGARSRSQDSVAKSSVKLATTAVITEVMAGGEPDFDKISKQETSISWTDGPSDGPKQVSISGGNNGDDSGGWAGRGEVRVRHLLAHEGLRQRERLSGPVLRQHRDRQLHRRPGRERFRRPVVIVAQW